jgi:hypothetical protein
MKHLHRRSRRGVIAATITLLFSPHMAAAQSLTTPPDWRWRLDAPATLVTGQDVPESAWRFVGMPPGWHVTTGPGVVLYHPQERATGRYSLTSNMVLFPNPTVSGYGIVFGAPDLSAASGAYLAAQLRRDGAVRVIRMSNRDAHELAPWRVHPAVKPNAGSGVVTNRLRVSVAPDSIRVFVNDSAVVSVSAAGLSTDGQFGLHVGEKLNMHITTLDYTRQLAPVPPAPAPAAMSVSSLTRK